MSYQLSYCDNCRAEAPVQGYPASILNLPGLILKPEYTLCDLCFASDAKQALNPSLSSAQAQILRAIAFVGNKILQKSE
jgi:hypothetical protein